MTARADWNSLAASGEVPPATYAYPGAAKWRRSDVLAALGHRSQHTPIEETADHD